MVTELLQKYIWLVQTFVRAGETGLTLGELSDKWERRFDSPYSRRTFNNHREAVEEVFGIRIRCNRSTNSYYIGYSEDVSDSDAETAWLINTFTVNNMLSLGKERLSGRVAVEDIPSGHMHLTAIMEAMTDSNEIVIGYQKYTNDEVSGYTIRPYAVKESARRWYVVGYCVEKEQVRIYGLDRVKSLEVKEKRFRMPADFDVDEMFATAFGPYIPEGPGCTVRFRAFGNEAKFIRDLPLHPSQKEVGSDSGIFEIFACPNRAMIMEFCKHGNRIEVLSPSDVREAVAQEFRGATHLYD